MANRSYLMGLDAPPRADEPVLLDEDAVVAASANAMPLFWLAGVVAAEYRLQAFGYGEVGEVGEDGYRSPTFVAATDAFRERTRALGTRLARLIRLDAAKTVTQWCTLLDGVSHPWLLIWTPEWLDLCDGDADQCGDQLKGWAGAISGGNAAGLESWFASHGLERRRRFLLGYAPLRPQADGLLLHLMFGHGYINSLPWED